MQVALGPARGRVNGVRPQDGAGHDQRGQDQENGDGGGGQPGRDHIEPAPQRVVIGT
jgi:hypothetical protein